MVSNFEGEYFLPLVEFTTARAFFIFGGLSDYFFLIETGEEGKLAYLS